MKPQHKLVSLCLLLALALSACSASAPLTPEMMEKPAATEAIMDKDQGDSMPDDTMMGDKPTDEAMLESKEQGEMAVEVTPEAMPKDEGAMADDNMPKEDEMMAMPGFFAVLLTDAATGQAFAIQDFKGKVVLVETLAMWCSSCLKQQKQIKALHEMLDERDDFISLGVDIDPNENMGDLQAYVVSNGFNWLYTIAPGEVAREIGQLYGPNFLNPPSTPLMIIDRHGEVHPLPFGIKSADDLFKALEPFLNEGM